MNSKALIVIALVLISGVAGFGLMLSYSDDAGIAYHGNGQDGQRDVVYSESGAAIPSPFSKDGMSFYGWNTAPDHSGTFYPVDGELSDTVTDLFAVWTYSFHGDKTNSVFDGIDISAYLVNTDSFIPTDDVWDFEYSYLDPDRCTAAYRFVTTEPLYNWAFDPFSNVLSGHSEKYVYSIDLNPVSGAMNIRVEQQTDGSVMVHFDYSDNVEFGFDSSLKYNIN